LGRASVRRRFRILGRVFAGLCALVLLAAIGVYVLGTSGIGTERLRAEAETAIEKLAGVDLNVTVGPARLTLDGSSFVALQVSDVSLKTADGKPMADVGRVRFGMRLLPLLSGEVKLTSARFSDARIMVAAMPSGSGDWTAALRNEDGLVDPEKVSAAVFGGVNAALDAVRAESMRQIDLRNVEFELPPGGSVRRLTVAQATVGQTGTGSMELSSKADVDGRHVSLSASAARDPSARRIASLDAAVAIADVGVTPAQGSSSGGNFAAQGGKLGSVALKLSGVEASGDTPSRLTASLSLGGSVLDLGSRGLLPADVDARATLV
ncbi:MAG: hypothetical protein E5X00_18345, partial [Mesorhizobium sp.]